MRRISRIRLDDELRQLPRKGDEVSLRATKSVSQLSSTIAGLAIGGDSGADDTLGRDAVRGLGRFRALLMRSSSSALPKSPWVSVSAFAFHHARPVRPRSSITMLAVTSAITSPLHVSFAAPPFAGGQKNWRRILRSLTQCCCLVSGNLDEFLVCTISW